MCLINKGLPSILLSIDILDVVYKNTRCCKNPDIDRIYSILDKRRINPWAVI